MIGRICFVFALLAVAPASRGLIFVTKGNAPATDHDWPAGSLDVANATNRLGWWEGPPFGGGETHFSFRGDNEALANAVSAFSRIKAPSLLIVVHDGTLTSHFFKDDNDPKDDGSVDYEFTVWTPESFHHLYNPAATAYPLSADQPNWHADVAPPRLDVYAAEGRIDWSRIPLPKVEGLTVQDERATANGYAPEDGAVVRGTVYDMRTSKPVAGAEAILRQRKPAAPDGKPQAPAWEQLAQATVDADGRFEIRHAPVGGSDLLIRHPGHATRAVGYLSLTKNACKTFPAIRLAESADLAGTVTDPAGKPLPNVTVRADAVLTLDGRGYPLDEAAQSTSDADGHFTLPSLPRGTARLFAHADGLHQLDSLAAHVVPAPNLVIKMAATGTVHGTATPKPGQSSSGQSVSIAPEGGNVIGSWGGGTQLNPDNTFEFTNVPPGRYVVGMNLSPDHPEKDPRAQKITVTPGQTTEVELK